MSKEEATGQEVQKEEAATEEEKAHKKRATAAKKESKSLSKDEIITAIKEMTVIELSELV